MRLWVAILPVFLLACAPASQDDITSRAQIAETSLPPMKLFSGRTPRTEPVSNDQLVADFLELTFQMENGTPLPVMTRFEGPITLRVTGQHVPTLSFDLEVLLTRLRREAGIEITLTERPDANITIEAVSRKSIQRLLPQAACFVVPNVSSLAEFRRLRRSPQTDWARLETRERLAIILPADESPQEVRDCLHEELAQALGPLNDLYRLPNSVFNDDNFHIVLTDFDMLMLKATYAPELRSGMTRLEAAQALPGIFARYHPQSRDTRHGYPTPTPQAFSDAIEAALGPGSSLRTRQLAADEALHIARTQGWSDGRLGFAHYTHGRVLRLSDRDAANRAFQKADAVYANRPDTRLHRAHVATYLAAHALEEGNPELARSIAAPNIPIAKDAENAALLASLKLLHAQALAAEGRRSEADAERLDSLGWARYGFGADWAVQSKLREMSTLGTGTPPS